MTFSEIKEIDSRNPEIVRLVGYQETFYNFKLQGTLFYCTAIQLNCKLKLDSDFLILETVSCPTVPILNENNLFSIS